MAQWQGQFTGRTHATKVKRLEASLVIAVSALKAAPKAQAGTKFKAAHGLAERLLSARMHLFRSRISAALEKQDGTDVELLRSREATARENGVDGILREFGVALVTEEAEQSRAGDARNARA